MRKNTTPSPINAGATAAHRTWEKERKRAPTAIAEPRDKTGIAGSGTPAVVSSTLAKTAALPQFSIAEGEFVSSPHL